MGVLLKPKQTRRPARKDDGPKGGRKMPKGKEKKGRFAFRRREEKRTPEGKEDVLFLPKRKRLSAELRNRRRATWFFLSPSIAGASLSITRRPICGAVRPAKRKRTS